MEIWKVSVGYNALCVVHGYTRLVLASTDLEDMSLEYICQFCDCHHALFSYYIIFVKKIYMYLHTVVTHSDSQFRTEVPSGSFPI